MGTHPIFESDFDCLTEMGGSGVRRDWYQSNERIILALLVKGTSNVTVEFSDQSFSCNGLDKDGNNFTEKIQLALPINPAESTFKVTGSKIEFKLKKATEGLRWELLEIEAAVETVSKPHNTTKDWDKIGKEAEEEFKKDVEEGGGEAALQQMFKNIYANANAETQRAMMKSFQESNGTVLSTNWNEVGKEKVEMKPPDSMEYRKWEG